MLRHPTSIAITGLASQLFLAISILIMNGCSCWPFETLEEKIERFAKLSQDALGSNSVRHLTRAEFDRLVLANIHTPDKIQPDVYGVSGVVADKRVVKEADRSDVFLSIRPWPDSSVRIDCLFHRSQDVSVGKTSIEDVVHVVGAFSDIRENRMTLIGCIVTNEYLSQRDRIGAR